MIRGPAYAISVRDQVLLSVRDCWREDQAANVKEYFARTTGLWTIPLCIDWFLEPCHR